MGAALFAEPITAVQAAEWGMIWEAVADDAFVDHVANRASHLANGPTGAYALVKSALRKSYDNDVNSQLALEAELQGIAGNSEDFIEGITAFLEKRKPNFKGR